MTTGSGYRCAYATIVDWDDYLICNITVGFPGDGSTLAIRTAYTEGMNKYAYPGKFYWLVLGI